MRNKLFATVLLIAITATHVVAEETERYVGINANYINVERGNSGVGVGINAGYKFNKNLAFDAEYLYKTGDPSGHLLAAFFTFTTSGELYLKGKIGGAAGGGDAFNGGSGSLGLGIGKRVQNNLLLELDVNLYSSDVQGVSLLLKRLF